MVVDSVVRTLAVVVVGCCVLREHLHWTRPDPDNQQLPGLMISYIIAAVELLGNSPLIRSNIAFTLVCLLVTMRIEWTQFCDPLQKNMHTDVGRKKVKVLSLTRYMQRFLCIN